YPVLIHSHGLMAWPGSDFHIADYLASHGWVVIEPQHTGNTFTDTPPTLPLAIYLQRPLDVRAALDLAGMMPPGDLLAGKLDLHHVAMSGHSHGTYTTWVVAGTKFDTALIQADCDKGGVTGCTPTLVAAFNDDLSDPRPLGLVPFSGGGLGYFGTN